MLVCACAVCLVLRLASIRLDTHLCTYGLRTFVGVLSHSLSFGGFLLLALAEFGFACCVLLSAYNSITVSYSDCSFRIKRRECMHADTGTHAHTIVWRSDATMYRIHPQVAAVYVFVCCINLCAYYYGVYTQYTDGYICNTCIFPSTNLDFFFCSFFFLLYFIRLMSRVVYTERIAGDIATQTHSSE